MEAMAITRREGVEAAGPSEHHTELGNNLTVDPILDQEDTLVAIGSNLGLNQVLQVLIIMEANSSLAQSFSAS